MRTPADKSDPEVVAFFGSWRAIYAAVLVLNLVAIAFVYLFSRFPF